MPAEPVFLDPGGGTALALGDSDLWFKAEGDSTAGALSVMEFTLAPGFPGPVPHTHREMTDIFYVLEGTVTFLVGEEQKVGAAGTFVLVPPGNVHTFSNPSDQPARLLNLQTPAGLEQYLKEVAALTSNGQPDPAEMARLASQYDFMPS
ncbi:MAG: cupin domain-containing protein [Solirubrobacteraceae bacterium]